MSDDDTIRYDPTRSFPRVADRLLAHGARVLLRRVEPLVQARRVELVVACPALELRDLPRCLVYDCVADRALLDSVKYGVDVVPEEHQRVGDGAVTR